MKSLSLGALVLLFAATGASAQLPLVTQALTVQINTGVLPFGLGVTSVHVTPAGLRIDAKATGLVVPVPDDASRS